MCIIFNVILIALYLFVIFYSFKRRKKIEENKDEYQFMTSYPKWSINLGYVFLAISLIFHILSIIFSFNETITMWVLFGCGAFFGIIVSILFYDLLLDFEAIKGDYLYVHRFFKKKVINIYDIEKVVFNGGSIVNFYNKDSKSLFIIDSSTKGFDIILQYIVEKTNKSEENLILTDEENFSVSSKNLSEKGKEIINQIGKEYKDSLQKKIKLTKLICLILTIVFVVILSILFINKDNPDLMVLLILSIIFTIICGTNIIGKYNEDKKKTTFALGKIHYYKNKKVKGSGIYRYNKKSKVTLVVSIMCFIFSVLMYFLPNQVVSRDSVELVSGEVEYITYQKAGKTYNLLIGIDGTDVEYRVSGNSLRATDKDGVLDEVMQGDLIYLLVKQDYKEDKGIVDKSKTQRTYVYEIYTSDKYYLYYEDYLYEHKKDTIFGFALSSVIFLFGIASLVYTRIIWKLIQKEIDNETIDIYQL